LFPDADLLVAFVADLDALRQCAQVTAAVAAAFQPHALAGHMGECLNNIGAGSPVAVERHLGAFRVRLSLIAYGFEVCDTVLQASVVQIGHTRFDGIVEPVESLVGLGESPVEFGKVLAAFGPLLAPVENACEDGFQPLGMKQAIFQVARDEPVELTHRDRSAFAAGVAWPCLGPAAVHGGRARVDEGLGQFVTM